MTLSEDIQFASWIAATIAGLVGVFYESQSPNYWRISGGIDPRL